MFCKLLTTHARLKNRQWGVVEKSEATNVATNISLVCHLIKFQLYAAPLPFCATLNGVVFKNRKIIFPISPMVITNKEALEIVTIVCLWMCE